jgi:glucosamine--fructose-6-phosphate aminotransferase (isomerizing)
MCGIVGYVGRSEAAPILLDGLRRLEYRGYDSAGVAIVDGDRVETRKCAGRIAALEKLMAESPRTKTPTHISTRLENSHSCTTE